VTELIALAIGYALGSVLPAYFIGLARGVDIRTEGTGNPGTLNAYHVLGPHAGIATALYDLTKGIVAVGVAWRLGVGEAFIYAAGLAAVLGHRHPFYLGFRGARGLSVNTGLAYLFTGLALYRGWLPWPWFAGLFVAYGGLVAMTRVGAIGQLVLLPVLYVVVLLRSTDPVFDAFFGVVLAFIWSLHFTALRDLPGTPVPSIHLPRGP
jgi:glycerol-3-phosphate acyltransferase PlsY